MPLQPVTPTEAVAATQIAQRFVGQVSQLAKVIAETRKNGIPAVAAREAGTGPNGQVIPARPATAAISAAAIDAALGPENCAILDTLAEALGL